MSILKYKNNIIIECYTVYVGTSLSIGNYICSTKLSPLHNQKIITFEYLYDNIYKQLITDEYIDGFYDLDIPKILHGKYPYCQFQNSQGNIILLNN